LRCNRAFRIDPLLVLALAAVLARQLVQARTRVPGLRRSDDVAPGTLPGIGPDTRPDIGAPGTHPQAGRIPARAGHGRHSRVRGSAPDPASCPGHRVPALSGD